MKSGNPNQANTYKRITLEEFKKDILKSTEIFNESIDKFVDTRIAPFLTHQAMHDTMFDYDSMKFIKWLKQVKTGNHGLSLMEIKDRCKILILWGRCFRYLAIMNVCRKDHYNISRIKPNDSILHSESWSISCDRNGNSPITICIDKETYSMNCDLKFIEYGVTMATKQYLKLLVKETPGNFLNKDIEEIVKIASWTYGELKSYEYKNDYIDFIHGRLRR